MNNYKIVFIDIDGTLRNSKKIISNANINAIKKLKELNILVVIISGRGIGHTIEIAKQCCASQYVISSTGAQIYDTYNNKYILKKSLNKNTLIELYNLANKYNLRLIMNDDSLSYDSIEYLNKNISFEEFIQDKKIFHCTILGNNLQIMKKFKEEIKNLNNVNIKNTNINYKNIPKGKFAYYDVAPVEISKGNTVKTLCDYLNIDIRNAVAIGDGLNDISMFQVVGKSIAMDNATFYVKKYATSVTSNVDEDGVAHILNKIFDL